MNIFKNYYVIYIKAVSWIYLMHELNISECYRITGRRVRASFSFSGSFQLLFPLAFFKDQNAVIVRGREDDEAESESSVATRTNWTDWIKEEKLTQAWRDHHSSHFQKEF